MVGTPNGIIFLLYNPLGTNYDAAIPCCYEAVNCNSTCTPMKVSNTKTNCSCGANPTESNISCAPNPSYATHCKCYQRGLSCSVLCKCKECANPFGPKPPKSAGQKELYIPMPCKQKSHLVKNLQLIEEKKYLEDFGHHLKPLYLERFVCKSKNNKAATVGI